MTNSETRTKLNEMYLKCLNATYKHLEEDADYTYEFDKTTGTLYLLFQWTHSGVDWLSNLDFFPAKVQAYKDSEISWRCHEGFHRVWKSIKHDIEKEKILDNPDIKRIYCIGYSHGAAIAAFAHEYCWYNKPELRDKIIGLGFGAPRMFFGKMTAELKERWKNFFPIRNCTDIVTHVPPRLFGFKHVAPVLHFYDVKLERREGEEKYPKCVLSHTYTNYMNNIKDGKVNGRFEDLVNLWSIAE